MINQLATPGLGSLMAGRIVAGTAQLILAVAGFLMIAGWFIQLAFGVYRQLQDFATEPPAFPWLGPAGAMAFLLSWLWALVTSLSLLRDARRNAGDKPG